MKRYLKSDDVLNTLRHLLYETALNQHDPYVADVFEDIAKNRLETWINLIPGTDVPERNVGKWMHDKDDRLISGYCSCCGWTSIICETDVADMPYCPNCGADMRGVEDGNQP